MCQGGSVTQESVLLDFFYAHDAGVVKCKCSVLIVAGKQFTFSEISSPGYNGCGSEITLSRDNSQNGDTHRITCLGGTTYSELIPGETLSIELHKKMEPMDTRYCYRLDISMFISLPMYKIVNNQITMVTASEFYIIWSDCNK